MGTREGLPSAREDKFGQELNQKILKSSNFTEGKINTLPGRLLEDFYHVMVKQ